MKTRKRKKLWDAKRDGDHIYGVIRGASLNHGGKTNKRDQKNGM